MIFVLDANLSPTLAQALHLLCQKEGIEFRSAQDEFGAGAADEDIFRALQGRGWFFVTLDVQMTRRPGQRRAMEESGIGAFVFTGSSLPQRSFREIAAFVLAVTDAMIGRAKSTTPPFVYGISDRKKFERLA